MLSITLEFVRGVLLFRLKGSLTSKTTDFLIKKLDEMIYEKGVKYMIINLEEIEYIDDVGINCLLKKYYDTLMLNGKLVICSYEVLNHANKIKLLESNVLFSNNELSALRMINI